MLPSALWIRQDGLGAERGDRERVNIIRLLHCEKRKLLLVFIWPCVSRSISAFLKPAPLSQSLLAMGSAVNILSQVQASHPAPWPNRGPESLISPVSGLAMQSIHSISL
ncbi:hypothetical protein PoB_003018600 [Plakobranchus ocellatus]|uniref:Uncharacterized protein n=1 Tax=Plakobranchus ocellatus TaxID=259542 RepID=A0AAV4A5Z4_9GAST|nr:hypothetical protein PoB_003018600 [Plakobranchus ocellatus]